MEHNEKSLSIIIGGDMDSDFEELFSGGSLKEIKQPLNALYLDSFDQLYRLLSPKRIDLLHYLIWVQSRKKPKSVSEIANELDRHQEAISRDLNALKRLGLVSLKKTKQTVFVSPNFSGIDIKVR